ncbi:D-alanine---D-serine ligase [Anaerotaenia torta]|uniref:D-alanine--D-serine ligase VanG n=1 Tax=Anaerotaenia torta TaxID=433293 RepID=UPI003D25850A
MKQTTIAVLFGGQSTEYEVSLQSACSVIENLNPEKYHVILLGITRQGEWLKYSGSTSQIQEDSWSRHPSCLPAVISPDRKAHGILVTEDGKVTAIPIDAAFPVLHGRNGEDGTVQGLLEMAGIPCIGCGTLSSALCMDKDIAHKLIRLSGIKTPESVVLDAPVSPNELYKMTADLQYPLFVKPVNSGSSFGITKVNAQSELWDAILTASRHDRKVIIEEAVAGFEVGCAVLGNETLTIGQVDEIELEQGFFDYTEKYTLKTSKIHMPARIDEDTANRVKQTAASIYRTLGCRGLARVDMFLTPGKEIVFNEVNTIPGFTSHSRYPNMLKGIGMTFPQIIEELIRLAMLS